jgi:CubicO group peptidase (beta-lactamase class C family)
MLRALLPLLLALCPDATATVSGPTPPSFAAALAVLEEGVRAHVFPGAVALVGRVQPVPGGDPDVLLAHAVGSFTYAPGAKATTVDTTFDLASCTKVVATTTAVAKLFGNSGLDTPVSLLW